jgi:hypothetical protein
VLDWVGAGLLDVGDELVGDGVDDGLGVGEGVDVEGVGVEVGVVEGEALCVLGVCEAG